MDALPYDAESLAGLFYDWCMAVQTPGRVISNDLFILREGEYSVILAVKPASGNIPYSIASYIRDSSCITEPELSLWFDDYTTKRVSYAVWARILHKFCPDSYLRLTGESWFREVEYPDGGINKGELFSGRTRQRICIYSARKQARRTSPLTFADMEGVL